jgi:hypothetical protein
MRQRQQTLNIFDERIYSYPPRRPRELSTYQAPQDKLELFSQQLAGLTEQHRAIAANALLRRGIHFPQLPSDVTDPIAPKGPSTESS